MPDSPLPPLGLLDEPDHSVPALSAETLEFTSPLIEKKLLDFGVETEGGLEAGCALASICMSGLADIGIVPGTLGDIGWRKVVIPAKRLYPHLAEDYACIDYSGWPLYAHESLSDEMAYKVVDAIHARVDQIKWDEDNAWSKFLGIGSLGEQTDQTPRDVPLHPGSERWFREHGYKV